MILILGFYYLVRLVETLYMDHILSSWSTEDQLTAACVAQYTESLI